MGKQRIKNKRQEARRADTRRILGLLILALAIFVLAQYFGINRAFSAFPVVSEGMGYFMIFIIGLFTSLHCVAMCGGINLSQTLSRTPSTSQAPPTSPSARGRKPAAPTTPATPATSASPLVLLRPSLLYNLGRVVSYTLVGGLIGALGSVIAFDGFFKGVIQLAAGVFMVIMALILLGIFPWLRQFNITLPRALSRFMDEQRERSKSPLVIGLLNGLMPCGPLQAMQLYALSTGSALLGALSMFAFVLGTVPLMFGLGLLGSLLTRRFREIATTAGAVLITILGFFMFSTGWNLSGLPSPFDAFAPHPSPQVEQLVSEDGYQLVSNTLERGTYPTITVRSGVPVKWNISAAEGSITGCNKRFFIPEYDIDHSLTVGDNIIEFTPTKPGRYSYSCWMGMIRGTIYVTEA
ncbi:MAG: sulfite exporter TauE/SafE family protein [Coriobacteriales bacterium]|jgi:sulfite exporter TauE/SafE|nr:sulfite exporter TauE/SafE family protein [Coriobacteriales bacterium]